MTRFFLRAGLRTRRMILLLRTTWAGKPRICIGAARASEPGFLLRIAAGVVVQKQDLDLRMVPGHRLLPRVLFWLLRHRLESQPRKHGRMAKGDAPFFKTLRCVGPVIASSH